MKRLIIIFSVLMVFLTKSTALLSDFDDGREAYHNGDFETALREWTSVAVHGNAQAQFLVGSMYDKGEGVPQDYEAAVSWFQRAADQGHIFAQYNLGLSYHYGNGVPVEFITAVIWYKLVAENGNSDPQNWLPVMYSMYNLGVMYANGEGVSQDYIIAHMWWSICASMGNEDARKNREKIERDLSPAELETANWYAIEWIEKYMQ